MRKNSVVFILLFILVVLMAARGMWAVPSHAFTSPYSGNEDQALLGMGGDNYAPFAAIKSRKAFQSSWAYGQPVFAKGLCILAALFGLLYSLYRVDIAAFDIRQMIEKLIGVYFHGSRYKRKVHLFTA